MKLIFLTITFFAININLSFSQEMYKAFDAEVFLNNKKLKGVRYYHVKSDTATILPFFKNKLFLDTNYLKEKATTLLAIYQNQKIVFKIPSNNFSYIKIQILRKGMTSEFEINLGLEYVTTIKASKRKFVLVN